MCVFLGVEIVHLNLPKMTLSLSYPETLGNGCAQLYIPSCRHISLPYVTIFAIKMIHQRIQTTRLHASCSHYCHYLHVDFVLFHNITCYTNYLLSSIHVDTTYLFNIMCTLVATCVILGRLECIVKFQSVIGGLEDGKSKVLRLETIQFDWVKNILNML